MAKKFFNKKVKRKRNNVLLITIIAICVIGIIVALILTTRFLNRTPENAIIEVHETRTIEVNSEKPSVDIYFKELVNVDTDRIKIDYDKVDFNKAGTYNVTIEVYDNDYTVKLEIVDTKAPTLVLRDYYIKTDTEYTANDFVTSCEDNSGSNCIIEFGNVISEDGTVTLDYSNFTSKGTYEVKIKAIDINGNETVGTAKLVIDNSTTAPKCEYGNLDYSSEDPIVYIVGSNNCAIDSKLYNDSKVQEPVDKIADTEYNKLKVDTAKIDAFNEDITLNIKKTAILNNEGIGIVGYTLFIEAVGIDNNVLVSYFVNSDGTRKFVENPYNLK